ncbi:MAG: DNA translocase FtsK 4TM domain-containing protein [Bacteroidetes bacterium]|nr:DNA translocase FtsK 4TM domain-containing protein [Bacteroidota bacterium]
MAEEEELITGNKFKTARNNFRKSREVNEDDEHSIEDLAEEASSEEVSGKDSARKSHSEKTEDNDETPAPKRKRKIPKEKVNPLQPVISFFKDERLHRVVGLALILTSIYLLVAFTSFLFTWKTDQDKVMGSWWQLFFPSDEVNPALIATGIDNWLGKLGAVVSHLFIHKGFGVASYFFVVFSFLAGFRILFKTSLFPLRIFFKRSLFIMFWSSVALGYIFHNDYFFIGGTFGYQTSLWLNKTLGIIGTGFLMVFSFFGFMAVSFNYAFDWMRSKESEQQMESLDTMAKTENLPSDNIDMEVITVQPILENKTEASIELPVEESIHAEQEAEKSLTFEMTAETEEKEKETDKSEDENVAFVVAPTKEEVVVEETEDDLTSFGEFDPTLELSDYQKPSIDLLKEYGSNEINVNQEELHANKDRIISTLKNFGIEIAKIKATVGPTVTLYEIIPAEGVRISKIKNLEDDIALSLAALGIRIIAPMPGKGTIGIEVPNSNPEIVSMRSIIASEKFQNTTFELPFGLGKTISNETFIADLTKMPHLLIAGTTGQGKSVGLNVILTSLLYKKHPAQVKFVLIDPKRVELTLFNKIERHFLAKLPNSEDAIITDTTKVIHTLKSLCMEMDDRLTLFNTAMVRNIKEYNTKFIARNLNPKKGHKFLPYIVVVVDEFGDLIAQAGKEIETPLTRLAAVARATGIHLIIATQRPSVNVVTGLIKANFPARIAFRVQSKIDSRTILDSGGADQLIGKGDMLFSLGSELIRLQCPFVDTPEVDSVTSFIGNQRGYPEAFKLPEYIDEDAEGMDDMDPSERDSFFQEAARIVVTHQQGSASLLQRKLKLGYNRAGRIVDQLESAGIIGPFKGSKAREVLIKDPATLEQLLSKADRSVDGMGDGEPIV